MSDTDRRNPPGQSPAPLWRLFNPLFGTSAETTGLTEG
jgi:hypothetical protein